MPRRLDFQPYTVSNPIPYGAQGNEGVGLSWNGTVDTETIANELANRPRYDLDGRRYGNTLSDDMFAMKNPNYQGHTPESFSYYKDQMGSSLPALEQTEIDPYEELLKRYPLLAGGDERLLSRKKNITGDSIDWETYPMDWTIGDDVLEFPDNYSQEALEAALAQRDYVENQQKINDLATDSLRADMLSEKGGAYHDPQDQWLSRRQSEFDPYLGTPVNYEALSPATLQQLAKMGVNRSDEQLHYGGYEGEDNAGDTLNFLINAYRQRLGL